MVFVGDQEVAGVLLTFHGHLAVAADELYMKGAIQATVQLVQPLQLENRILLNS